MRTSTKLCIDLCSGLGGFSRAFKEAGWEVITVDMEPKFKPTICADIRELSFLEIIAACKLNDLTEYQKVVVLASPPCTHFSVAGLPRGFPRKGTADSLRIVAKCIEIIEQIQPNAWFIENPSGMLRVFMPFRPVMKIRLSDYGAKWKKPTDIWSDTILPLIKGHGQWEKASRGAKTGIQGVRDPAKRAEMPLGLSQAILEAVA